MTPAKSPNMAILLVDDDRDIVQTIKANLELVKGEEIKLTKTEYDLLGFFVSNPDEILTRDFIQANVWRDSQLYSYSRAVDVQVQRLRKKIETDLENPRYIITVAGVGYKFKTD